MSAPESEEKSALSAALTHQLHIHQITPADLPLSLSPEDAAALAALCNDRLATVLTISTWELDAIPVQLTIPPLPDYPKAQFEGDPAAASLAKTCHKARSAFLQLLQDQIQLDGQVLTQQFRGQLRALTKAHKQQQHHEKLLLAKERNRLQQEKQRSTFTAEITRLRAQLAYTQSLHSVARARSDLLAARAKLKLERKLAWQKEYMPRKKLETQIRKNAAWIAGREAAEQLEREKQEEVARISREAMENYLTELEAEAEIWKDKKLEAICARPFSLSQKERALQEKALKQKARLEAQEAEDRVRVIELETRKLKAEHGLELAKEVYLNKKTQVANLRELNAAKAVSLGFDPTKPLSVWKAAEKRARELGLSVSDLPTEAANDSGIDDIQKEQKR